MERKEKRNSEERGMERKGMERGYGRGRDKGRWREVEWMRDKDRRKEKEIE